MVEQRMSESLVNIGNSLKKNEKRIAAKLGGMIKWEYFCSAFLTMVEKNPMLAQCSEASLVRAVLDAAQLRLIPDGVLGEAYLVPYGKTATLIVGYKGLIQLCLRSGQVKKISARMVYENDYFKYEYGMNEACTHIPTEEEAGQVRGAYAVFEMADGVKGFEFWPYKKLMNHKIQYSKGLDKKDSKGKYTSPWRTNEEAMILKTTLRSITKLLPKSIEEISQANAIEDVVSLKTDEAIDVEISKPAMPITGSSTDNLDALKDKVDAQDHECIGTPPDLNPGIADEGAEPPDDIPIADPELINGDELKAFLDKSRSLGITTKALVTFVKNNGFNEADRITKDKIDGMIKGLTEIAKK